MLAVAFYLPQFHVIPENEEWHGKGYVEWTKVRAAEPMFPGHYQPRIPHPSIGYYDLADMGTLEKQHDIAYRYGVQGFCYYYYNIAGKTLLEKPVRMAAASRNIKNRFCLCWANHNWIKKIDGVNHTLLTQEYSREKAKELIHAIERYLVNDRYITVNGKPVLACYMPENNPLICEYADIWREEARIMGFGDLYLVGVEAMSQGADPAEYGFDAMMEFAPDWVRKTLISAPDERPRRFDYKDAVIQMMHKSLPEYVRFRCVFPGWDNTARHRGHGFVFDGATPGIFKYFTEFAVKYTKEHLPKDAQMFFINAWNEWGEGCYLEPDVKNGYAYLEILRDALASA